MSFSKRKLIIGVAILVVIAASVVILSGRRNEKKTAVQTGVAERQAIVEKVTATGRIEPRTRVKISADVAAKITFLDVKEGDWVEAGDLLVRLDREVHVATLEQAEANLRSVMANANLARETLIKTETDFERVKKLVDRNLESRAAYDQAHSAVQVEKARSESAQELVQQAQAAVKQAKDNLSKTTIYAPMSGTISTLNKEVGEIALGSQFQEDVIMIVSDLSQMEALVDVDENDIVNISLGDSASIEIDAIPDRVFHGIVREIASSASVSGVGSAEQKTEFEVKLAIVDPAPELRPGMTASADIVIETRGDALCVPIQCITVRTPDQLEKAVPAKGAGTADSASAPLYTPDKDGFVTVVFVVENGTAKAVQVATGIQSDTHIEILSGISEGAVIVTGSYRVISQTLRNDMAVTIEKEPQDGGNGGDQNRS